MARKAAVKQEQEDVIEAEVVDVEATEDQVMETTGTELVVVDNSNLVPLGSITVPWSGLIEVGSQVAEQLKDVLIKQHLVVSIKGKRYVLVEGWNLLASMLGASVLEVETAMWEDGTLQSTYKVVRNSDGLEIGRASAIMAPEEWNDGKHPKFARYSMVQTRAAGKALRLAFGWVVNLAGYESTPSEEMSAAIGEEAVPVSNAGGSTTSADPADKMLDAMRDMVSASLGLSESEATEFVIDSLTAAKITKATLVANEVAAADALSKDVNRVLNSGNTESEPEPEPAVAG